MSLFIIVIHVIVCIALIMIVLLQTGKGADMGAAFGGGGSQTLFGSSGAGTFLSKLTTVAAIIFMLTSLSLAYMRGNQGGSSILSDQPKAEQPSQETTPMPAQQDSQNADTNGQTQKAVEQNHDENAQPAAETKAADQTSEQKESNQ